jgi:hypothetical protein
VEQRTVVGDKRRWLEPGGVDVLVDLGLNPGKDLIPDRAGPINASASHNDPLKNAELRDFRPDDTAVLRPVYPSEPARRP